ncbi:outer membrane protein [Parabacteroides sp. PF5-5]|uniref:OmpH family outer membrane protein n=1 Tax=unclassified Parabacteroides TaxID=2649774 RepID=UPI00247464AB|nr:MULTISPECIES: OmpH family outer membrane protein [unclassified Parabacteroides]MDH6306091.1 outer membrane protein [Parabacteroides sp. PH5-39]MDH6317011.1 outer membrane protein [Parabacteroides sp. PF5-13]MDH6320764.1 outer membrane protein [Parabacteroides sp. PH5-13]MDH6324534.1 outer membrane protein [Parabacteroides sp. PH5-8]MDH6328196.1 outer membrane protein [Parabacteroides sp. PH5-41]
MKKLIVLLCMILPLGVVAQEMKIAYVNVQEIFSAMPEIPTIEKQLEELNQKYDKELRVMQEEYQRKSADYIAQQDSLTENIKLKRMQEIEDIRTRVENFIPVAQQDIQKKQQELIAPVQEKIQNAIKAIGEEKGYTYIIDPQVFLYTGNSAINATSFVKTKLGI